jgi:PAS domain-containing protein
MVTSVEISDRAPAAIALLGEGGKPERATAQFLERCGEGDDYLAEHQAEIEQVLSGQVNYAALELDGSSAELHAVIAPDGNRAALLTILSGDGDGARDRHPLLDEPIDLSPAIVWLKDLEGRYMRVNRRYVEQLHADPERVCGSTDAELPPGESIEGLRLRSDDSVPQEPLELEYTVGAFDDRPAFAVLRFALRDGSSTPIAVCGVAAPLPQAGVARAECERLMRIERWSRLDDAAIREELLDQWSLEPVAELEELEDEPPELPGDALPAPEAAPAEPEALVGERLRAELADALEELTRDRIAAPDGALAEALAEATRRAEKAELALEQAREQVERAAEGARSEAEAARTQAEQEVAKAREDAEQVAAALEAERETVEELRAELHTVRDELAAARDERERLEQQVGTVNADHDELQQALAAVREELEHAQEAAAEAVKDELERERARTAQAESATEEARAELVRGAEELARLTAELEAEQRIAEGLRAELVAERQELDQVRAELAAAQHDLERAQNDLERAQDESATAAREELERERARAARAERAAEQACEEAAGTAALLDAERQTSEQLRVQLQAREAAGADEAEAANTAALATAQQRSDELQQQLDAARAELEAKQAEVEKMSAQAAATAPSAPAHEPAAAAGDDVPRWTGATQRAVSAALSGVSEWRTALSNVVKALGDGGWDAAVAWSPDERRGLMKCVAMATAEGAELTAFETRTWQHRQDVSGTEFGRARNRAVPSCVLELGTAEDSLLRAAAAEGMRSAVLIPIAGGAETIAMLELLSSKPTAPDADVMLFLEGVGLQLSSVAQLLNTAASPRWRLGRV